MSGSVLSLPYSQSRPLILAGRLTAPLVAGVYTWDGSPFDAVPAVTLRAEYLYILASVSVAADLDGSDYSAAIDTSYAASPIPTVRILQRFGQSVLPDAVPVPTYFSDLGILYPFAPRVQGNGVQFSALGQLVQTPALVGKPSVSLAVSALLYEVIDPVWIRRFMATTPAPQQPERQGRAAQGDRDPVTLTADWKKEVFG